MNEITKKALALINQVEADRGFALSWQIGGSDVGDEALCRAIEQHEAYKREVSDAVEVVVEVFKHEAEFPALERFIIPKPTVDPLEDVLAECDDGSWDTKGEYAAKMREALAKRGLKIVEIER